MSTTSEANAPAWSPSERRFFIREILGILEAVAALLILLALIANETGRHWVGSFGDAVAPTLTFFLGRYIAYIVPVLLAVDAWTALMGRTPSPHARLRSGARLFGAALLLVSTCALLTLHLTPAGSVPKESAFAAGGLIGSFLIHEDGFDLTSRLGRAGALVAFYGLTFIGIVLFTETLLRDLGLLLWRAMIKLFPKSWFAWLGRATAATARLTLRLFGWLSLRGLRLRLAEFIGGIEFSQGRRTRILAPDQIEEIRLLEDDGPTLRTPGAGPTRTADEDDWDAPRPRKKKGAFGRDEANGSVFPRSEPLERRAPVRQPELDLFPENYEIPPISMLTDPPATNYRMSEQEAEELARKIESTLAEFRIEVEVTEVVQGPVVTRFALRVAPGIRVNSILKLDNDLAMALRKEHVRILAPIPGQAAIGIEVPNKRTNPVLLKELLESEEFRKNRSALAFALGKNIAGESVIADLARMPHILIAGATGAGKSVCLNCVIASILFRNSPDRVRFVMVDPKRVELSVYQGIPHLLAPVVCEPRKAASALAWTVELMEQRYKLLAEVGVRNIESYNAVVTDRKPNRKAMGRELKFMPRVVVVIDELADLMMVAKNEVEEYIIRLAQMARAVGIHLVLATQRPSVNVITGIIKANFPTRAAFRVSSKVDSRTILDMNGAEALLGRGDMLYSPGGIKPMRIQCAFVSDDEIERLTDFIRGQQRPQYEVEEFQELPSNAQRAKAELMRSAVGRSSLDEDGENDGPGAAPTAGRAGSAPLAPGDLENLSDEDLYDVALRLILESRKASVSYIQRRLKIGYARAGRLMDMMEEHGVVGPYQGSKPRDLLVEPKELLRRLDEMEREG